MALFEDRSWTSRDGLRLHFRDYPARESTGPDNRPPLLCLHGLTRNARDFEDLAARLSGQWRVICPDMRGRGDSDYARDPMTYSPVQYFDDIEALLEEQAITRFVAIGTSMGGLLTMMLAARAPERVAAAVLNDIGPEVDPAGLVRIREYVGQGRSHETWVHAARALQDTFQQAYPRYELADWLRMAKRVMVIGSGGRIVFDYDMNIAIPFSAPAGATPAPDMWPMFDALIGAPLLLVRGGLSNILAADTASRMAARAPGIELVTLPDVGHAPTLDEAPCVAAIDRLLARVS